MSSSESSEASPPPNSSSHDEASDTSLGLSDISTSTSTEEEEPDLLEFDPTPWNNPYPQPQWFSCRQFISREYGKNVKPGLYNKRPDLTPYNPYWFRKYAYNSLYFIQRMERSDTLEGHSGCVNSLNFNESGDLLCSGSDDLHVNIWDWQKSSLKHSFSSGHTSNVFESRWCLNDTHIITCARDGQIRICDINNISGSSKRIAHHSAPIHKFTFRDPQVVLSCGEDAAVYEIDLRCNKSTLLFIFRNQKNRLIPLYSINCNMTFTPNYFAISGRFSYVSIFDRRYLAKPSDDESSNSSNASSYSSSDTDGVSNRTEGASNPSPVMKLCASANENSMHSITSAVYNSTGTKILLSYNDDDLYVFDIKTGKQEGRYQGHRNSNTVKGCFWFGDDFVLSGSDDGYIYGWDRKSQHIVMSVEADHSGAVNCLELHPQIPVIASSGIDDSIKIFAPTADTWPKALTGIKKRICRNIKERTEDNKQYSFDTGGLAIWLVMRDIRQRIQNRRNQEEDDSDSQEDGENSTDGLCHPA